MLQVCVLVLESEIGQQVFLAKMNKDGRITIPKFTMQILRKEKNLSSSILEVMVSPAKQQDDTAIPAHDAPASDEKETKILDKISKIRKNIESSGS